MTLSRRCKKCGEEKPLTAFEKHKQCADGFSYRCLDCARAYKAYWAIATGQKEKRKSYFDSYNKSEVASARKRLWKKENPEKNGEINKRWWANNQKKAYQYAREFYARNPGRVHSWNAARRRHIKKATPVWSDLKSIEALYEKAASLSKETGVRYAVDHIVPLRSTVVCGLHVPSNVRVITASENSRKRNKLLEGLL